jgi:hypothetical protein
MPRVRCRHGAGFRNCAWIHCSCAPRYPVRADGGADTSAVRKSVAKVAATLNRLTPSRDRRRARYWPNALSRPVGIYLSGASPVGICARGQCPVVAATAGYARLRKRQCAVATKRCNFVGRAEALRRLVWDSAASAWRGLADAPALGRRSECGRCAGAGPVWPASVRCHSQVRTTGPAASARAWTVRDRLHPAKIPVEISLHRAPTPARCAPGPSVAARVTTCSFRRPSTALGLPRGA